MAHRANTAYPWGDLGHFLHQPTFAEFFEAAEFIHMKVSMLHRAIFFQMNGHFGVPLDAGYGFNRYFLGSHLSS